MKRIGLLFLALALGCSRDSLLESPNSLDTPPKPSLATSGSQTYSTDFNTTENPISEGGRWINGGTVGLDWTNVSTESGNAIGHQVGASYTDATAVLSGPWSADQQATATVFYNGGLIADCAPEVELRLRSTIKPHDNHGYEIAFGIAPPLAGYLIIVRWNGNLGNFTYLSDNRGSNWGVKSGDVVSAKIVGNLITVYRNGVQMAQATDNTYTDGTPGMGFNLENSNADCRGKNALYGYSSFTAAELGGVAGPVVTGLVVTPGSTTVQTSGTQQFTAVATMSDGSTNPNPGTTWTATGGTISASGLYTAGGTAGSSFRVIGSAAGRADTSAITIQSAAATVTSVVVSPGSAALSAGQTQQFTAVAQMSDGSSNPNPAMTWTATGGAISSSGLYTAGGTAGASFRVIGTVSGRADTSAVTIQTAGTSSFVVTPGSVSLPLSGRQQFSAAMVSGGGGSQPVSGVSWKATGGFITSNGLFFAGRTSGNFRVIGRAPSGQADTSTVAIGSVQAQASPPPPTVTSIVVAPNPVTLQTGQVRQFTATATMSDGTTQSNPSVSWSATGGSITAAGSYTAGALAGSWSVSASMNSGAVTGMAQVSVQTAAGSPQEYYTGFAQTENPVSEGGRWINGATAGLDWSNVSTTPGFAIGGQTGGTYNNATALLTGTWGANQQAMSKVFTTGTLNDACSSDVELRLRSTLTAHSSQGYEVGFKVSSSASASLDIVRWNGALGDFTILLHRVGSQYGVKNGDLITAKVVGNVITAYKNGVQVGQVVDNTYTSGNPGLGFYLDNAPSGCQGTNSKYGVIGFGATNNVP